MNDRDRIPWELITERFKMNDWRHMCPYTCREFLRHKQNKHSVLKTVGVMPSNYIIFYINIAILKYKDILQINMLLGAKNKAAERGLLAAYFCALCFRQSSLHLQNFRILFALNRRTAEGNTYSDLKNKFSSDEPS